MKLLYLEPHRSRCDLRRSVLRTQIWRRLCMCRYRTSVVQNTIMTVLRYLCMALLKKIPLLWLTRRHHKRRCRCPAQYWKLPWGTSTHCYHRQNPDARATMYALLSAERLCEFATDPLHRADGNAVRRSAPRISGSHRGSMIISGGEGRHAAGQPSHCHRACAMHCTVLTLTPCAAAITRTRPIFPAQIGVIQPGKSA